MVINTLQFHSFNDAKSDFLWKKKKKRFIYLPSFFCLRSGWHRNLFIQSRENKLICQPEKKEKKHQKDIFTP